MNWPPAHFTRSTDADGNRLCLRDLRRKNQQSLREDICLSAYKACTLYPGKSPG